MDQNNNLVFSQVLLPRAFPSHVSHVSRSQTLLDPHELLGSLPPPSQTHGMGNTARITEGTLPFSDSPRTGRRQIPKAGSLDLFRIFFLLNHIPMASET